MLLPAMVLLVLPVAYFFLNSPTAGQAGNTLFSVALVAAVLNMAAVAWGVYTLAMRWLRALDASAAVVRAALGPQDRMTPGDELEALRQGVELMAKQLSALRGDMRQRVAEATDELTRQKQAIELASQAKSRFLASASHDLRQPMHAIGLFASALEPHVATEEGKAILGKIQASLATTESLFGAVLDVSRLDAGSVQPQVSRISVPHLLERLRDDFQYEAAAHGLRIRVHAAAYHVESDPVLLDRILRNLVSNALRYTDKGGILLAARRHGDNIRFQVWDSGIGIPAEHFSSIFTEFYQVQPVRQGRMKGLGLGLAIVDRLARLLGHRLDLRSVTGKGSVFSLDVPLAEAAASGGARAMESPAASYTRLDGRVLLLDDDEEVLDALGTLLQGWGLDVTIARDGTEAMRQLRQPPSLVVTDYRLGASETGLDVVDRLRHLFRGATFPVIVITGDMAGACKRSVAEQAYPLLNKPVQPAKLRALVTRLLRRDSASA